MQAHVFARSGYVVSHALEIHCANLHCTHAQYIVCCIQYYDCIIESCDNICKGIEVVYDILMLLFLKILYNKIICPVLTVC